MKNSGKIQQSSPKPMNPKGGISQDSFKFFKKHFEEWADGMYGRHGYALNRGIEKNSLVYDFLLYYPVYGPIMTVKRMKKSLLEYCAKHRLMMNPHRLAYADTRDKIGGREFYVIADANFNAKKIDRISMSDQPTKKKPNE